MVLSLQHHRIRPEIVTDIMRAAHVDDDGEAHEGDGDDGDGDRGALAVLPARRCIYACACRTGMLRGPARAPCPEGPPRSLTAMQTRAGVCLSSARLPPTHIGWFVTPSSIMWS